MDDSKIRKYIDEGGILAEMFFDFHLKTSNPEDAKALATSFCNDFINDALSRGIIYFGVAEIEPPERNDEYVSTYAKLTLLFKSLPSLITTVINYNPVALEIIQMKDDKITIEIGNLQDMLNEISREVFDIKTNMITETRRRELEKIYRARLEKGKEILARYDKDRDQRV
ncbi:MAG: hypothetical protein NZ908_02530 [Candidatus Micrarchaeota archaeon]|nr:hypothetical protein [Candidatus Micrarchaeota archaeon]MCX8154807.1 hypothetical protein [Candidatus Micrarchaeota archaeon]